MRSYYLNGRGSWLCRYLYTSYPPTEAMCCVAAQAAR